MPVHSTKYHSILNPIHARSATSTILPLNKFSTALVSYRTIKILELQLTASWLWSCSAATHSYSIYRHCFCPEPQFIRSSAACSPSSKARNCAGHLATQWKTTVKMKRRRRVLSSTACTKVIAIVNSQLLERHTKIKHLALYSMLGLQIGLLNVNAT